jgi:hypothetical protein
MTAAIKKTDREIREERNPLWVPSPIKDFSERIHFEADSLRRHNTGWWATHTWQGLAFSRGALLELAHIAGVVDGMRACGNKDIAQRVRNDIMDRLDYLNQYGDDRFKVVLTSDRWNPMNFGIAWYRRVTTEQWALLGVEGHQYDPKVHPWREKDGARYAYAFNGGLICHGFGQENYTINLGDTSNLWGVHT